MTETIEVEVTETVHEMLLELREQHGERVIQADLQQSVSQAIRNGYANSQEIVFE